MVKENIVIDNDSRRIYVNGREWLPSPESYLHLGRGRVANAANRPVIERHVRVDPRIAMYQSVQRFGG